MADEDDDQPMDFDYPSSNACVRGFNNCFCSWGKKKTPYDVNGNIRGQTSPLWENPAKLFFKIICGVAFILVILFVLAFGIINHEKNDIVDNSKVNEGEIKNNEAMDSSQCVVLSKNEIKGYFVAIGAGILFINAFYFLYMGCKHYSSDQEWFKYLIIGLIFWVLLVGINIVILIILLDNKKYYDDHKEKVFKDYSKCKNIFKANMIMNLIVCILGFIICILVLIRIIILFVNFFCKSYVPHTAKCVDNDIIIVE